MTVEYIESTKRSQNIATDIENGHKIFFDIVEESKSSLGVIEMNPPEDDISADAKLCNLLVMKHEKILISSNQAIFDMYAFINW